MSKKIIMRVPLDGISTGKRSVSYEAEGFIGQECKTATEAFERALGSVEEDTLKEEYYQQETGREYTREGGNGGEQ